MGLPDDYILPDNSNEACHLTGDGVVVPAVRFLADALIEPRGLAHGRMTASCGYSRRGATRSSITRPSGK